MGQKELFSRVFVHPSTIALMPNGQIKILNPIMANPVDRHVRKQTSYYSPEKLYDFAFQEDEKSAVF
jgi:hypothetical protein